MLVTGLVVGGAAWISYLMGYNAHLKKLLRETHNQYRIPISLPMPEVERMVMEYYSRLAEEGFEKQTQYSAARLAIALVTWARGDHQSSRPHEPSPPGPRSPG